MIGRSLRAVPATAWALLPGVLIALWWLGHEPPSVELQAELDEVRAGIDELDEYRERADELPALGRQPMPVPAAAYHSARKLSQAGPPKTPYRNG